MGKKLVRDDEALRSLVAYLEETGLSADVFDICKRHHVTLREVFSDDRGKSVVTARLEVWFWLTDVAFKSHSEVARMFARSTETVTKAMKKLRDRSGELQRVIDEEKINVARAAAKIIALDAKKREEMFGKLAARMKFGADGIVDDTSTRVEEVAPTDDRG